MSKERIKISPEFFDIMPPEYQDLVTKATYGNAARKADGQSPLQARL